MAARVWKCLALVVLLLAYAAPGASRHEVTRRDADVCKSVDRPAWEDIGMCDVLAVPCGQSLTPPSTVRPLPGNQTVGSAQSQSQNRLFPSLRRHDITCRSHPRSGFIYMLRRLRL